MYEVQLVAIATVNQPMPLFGDLHLIQRDLKFVLDGGYLVDVVG